MFEICSKLTIKTPERRQERRSGVFIVNFKQISHIAVVFPLLILNKQMPAGDDNLNLNEFILKNSTKETILKTINEQY